MFVCLLVCVCAPVPCARVCARMEGDGELAIFRPQLPAPKSSKKHSSERGGRDRDRATAAFCRHNRILIETINIVLIIEAQVLRWRFLLTGSTVGDAGRHFKKDGGGNGERKKKKEKRLTRRCSEGAGDAERRSGVLKSVEVRVRLELGE